MPQLVSVNTVFDEFEESLKKGRQVGLTCAYQKVNIYGCKSFLFFFFFFS